MTIAPIDEVEVCIDHGRVYTEGWQSWSPATTYALGQAPHRPDHPWQQTMRFRPAVPIPAQGFQGEGLLVVDPGTGDAIRTYRAPDASRVVPCIRARLDGSRLLVTADAPVQTEQRAGSIDTALAGLGDQFSARMNVSAPRPAPTVWCSWYHYGTDVSEGDITENLAAIDEHRLPVDVVQIDDGWEVGVGDWTARAPRFPSLSDLASRIRDSGKRAGIWVAPFTVGSESELFREHPDWLVGWAGRNWDQDLYGLDLTHPGARDYLGSVFNELRAAGFDYFKLDFLYAGALPGRRQLDVSAVAAYRSGLQLVRQAVTAGSYLLGCGAPVLPSVGLVDAMRVSPDTCIPAVPADPVRPDTVPTELRGRTSAVGRGWQQGRLWVNDADCLVARPSFAPRREWAEHVERYSGLRSASDRIADLDEWGLDVTRRLLSTVPPPTPFAHRPAGAAEKTTPGVAEDQVPR